MIQRRVGETEWMGLDSVISTGFREGVPEGYEKGHHAPEFSDQAEPRWRSPEACKRRQGTRCMAGRVGEVRCTGDQESYGEWGASRCRMVELAGSGMSPAPLSCQIAKGCSMTHSGCPGAPIIGQIALARSRGSNRRGFESNFSLTFRRYSLKSHASPRFYKCHYCETDLVLYFPANDRRD